MKIIGNGIYDVCSGCAKIIRVNKPIFGSVHFCTTDEEREQYSKEIRKKYLLVKSQLDKA